MNTIAVSNADAGMPPAALPDPESVRVAVVGSRVLVLGAARKANRPDFRNSKIETLAEGFRDYRAGVEAYDPCADANEMRARFGAKATGPLLGPYDTVLLAVPQERFLSQPPGAFRSLMGEGGILYDVARALPYGVADAGL